MALNPLKEKGIPVEKQLRDWSQLNMQPYDKKGRDPAEFLPSQLPPPLIMESNIDYVREIMAAQTDYNAMETEYVPGDQVPSDHRYYAYQSVVNGEWVPSQAVVGEHIEKHERDYRFEPKGPHPVERFRQRDQIVR